MKSILIGSASALAFAAMGQAYAQTPTQPATTQPANSQASENEGRGDVVVVTATRREEDVQDVPLSITAFSQEQMTEAGIVGYEGLAQATPGVILNKQSANFNNFTARGIATNGYGANLQSSVTIYVDELPISTIGNSTVLDPNLFDVERVEFLRGPQGTLFGSGSLAGALRILNKNPDLDEFQYNVLADIGQVGDDSLRQRYNAMVNVPLIEDEAALRIVGFYRDEEGWIDNVGTGIDNSNTLKDWGGRAILLVKPTDRLTLRALASYEDNAPEDASLQNPALGKYKRNSVRPDRFTGKMANFNFTLDYNFDWATLTSSSTYSLYDQEFFVDLAGAFGGLAEFGLDASGEQRTFVQEARLASSGGGAWDWVVGGFYLDRRLDVDYVYRSTPEFLDLLRITGTDGDTVAETYVHIDSSEVAAFGELTYHFSDQLWATAGMRYGSTAAQGFTDGGYQSNYLLFPFNQPLLRFPLTPGAGRKVDEAKPSYKASISYAPSNDLTTYATVSTGFRTPVVNANGGRVSIINPADIVIPLSAESDNLINYEVGAKGNFFDHRLTAHVAAYYIVWDNIQVQANRQSDSIQFATNIGEAISQGIEFELAAFPTDNFSFGLNGAFNDAKVTELTAQEAAISGAVMDARLASPEFQGSVWAKLDFDLMQNVPASFIVNYAHVGDYPNMLPNVPGLPGVPSPLYGFTDSYGRLNASLGAKFDNGLSAQLYVENALDDDSITYIHPEAFVASRFGTMAPRTIGVRLAYQN